MRRRRTKESMQRLKWFSSVFNYLEKQKCVADEIQDIDLFNYYSNAQSQWSRFFDGKPMKYLDAVPSRFYRQKTR